MNIQQLVHEVNFIISKESWFDMEVYKWDGGMLTIVGGIDLTYWHSLRISIERPGTYFVISVNSSNETHLWTVLIDI